MKLKEKVAIVSGGGGAIGRAVCLKLAEAGAKIAVFDLYQESADKVAKELESIGCSSLPCAVDISQYESVHETVKQVHQHFGRIDMLVNCAGGSARERMAEFHEQSIDVIHEMLQVNLFGALHCIRAVSPFMVEAKQGNIVNITSIVARCGARKCAEYGAAKGGLIAATKSLAIELGPHNININCVSPGRVERTLPEDELAFAQRHSVLNRICTQDDIAETVLFMMQPGASYITGQDLAVDGGRSLGLRGSH
ncbi:SDR family NAD(P)-dependent oxidoreductase [Kiritimatiellaeota bacterium B1221]|nr:SDR family NAD(P)-dependent oxidoreductase [Kiritimatiellaeota bacterium B1221]